MAFQLRAKRFLLLLAACRLPAKPETGCLQVLGTFITEWAAGRACCLQMLQSTHEAEQVAAALARIAAHYGFDGYLLNLEVMLPPELVPTLLHFIKWVAGRHLYH